MPNGEEHTTTGRPGASSLLRGESSGAARLLVVSGLHMRRIQPAPALLFAFLCCWIGAPVGAQTTGLVPLTDLGPGYYNGFQGGLYPGGTNVAPPAHLAAALQMSAQVVPRDAAGNPDPNGFIVFIAIGMSNTTHEFAVFERNEDANPGRNARVVLMDTALGGQSAAEIIAPGASYWNVVQQRLTAAGLTAAQVQVAWLKEADAQPSDNFPVHAQVLRDELESIANNLNATFPNLRLCYLSSRTYGGYAQPGTLNPEPQAYESGFAVKWLIEDQINGDPGLNYGASPLPVLSPLLFWGPYLWADGTNPRSDGLTWLISDFENDHTHPSPAGEEKVAGLLSAFFAGEPTASSWWPVQPDAALVTVNARDDAYVSAASPGTNFGQAAQLLALGGASPVNTYLAFEAGPAGTVAALAKLSLRVIQSGGGRVSLVDDTTWSEGTIVYTGAPPIGPALVEMPQSSRDGTIAAQVTGSVNSDADGVLAFALTTPASSQTSYHSREAGQPPRLVLVVPSACLGTPDSDGDGHPDGCDCDPGDPGAFAAPGEMRGLRWVDGSTLAWDSAAAIAGTGTRYDVLAGDLAEVSLPYTGSGDVCLADDLAATGIADTTPSPPPGSGLFFLVRAANVCGQGPYRTSIGGEDRASTACP